MPGLTLDFGHEQGGGDTATMRRSKTRALSEGFRRGERSAAPVPRRAGGGDATLGQQVHHGLTRCSLGPGCERVAGDRLNVEGMVVAHVDTEPRSPSHARRIGRIAARGGRAPPWPSPRSWRGWVNRLIAALTLDQVRRKAGDRLSSTALLAPWFPLKASSRSKSTSPRPGRMRYNQVWNWVGSLVVAILSSSRIGRERPDSAFATALIRPYLARSESRSGRSRARCLESGNY